MEGCFALMILSAVFTTLCLCSVPIPNSDACGEDVLYQSSIGLGENAIVQASFPEQTNEDKPLLGFFHCRCGGKSPAQV